MDAKLIERMRSVGAEIDVDIEELIRTLFYHEPFHFERHLFTVWPAVKLAEDEWGNGPVLNGLSGNEREELQALYVKATTEFLLGGFVLGLTIAGHFRGFFEGHRMNSDEAK